MNFCEALSLLCADEHNRMTRSDWTNKDEYGLMRAERLQIHTKGKFHDWILSYGDLLAEDWIII